MSPTMSYSIAALKKPVSDFVLSSAEISWLFSSLWNAKSIKDVETSASLEYYFQQCDLFFTEQDHLAHQSSTVEASHIQTHADIVNTASAVLSTSLDRNQLVNDLLSQWPQNAGSASSKAMLESSVNWAARLVTMMEVGVLSCALSLGKPLEWKAGSLNDFLADLFEPSKPDGHHVRLEKLFNAVNIERMAGLEVEWTSDLASHLSLRDDDTKLLIFHHATFLESVGHDLFPSGLLEETSRTLALLLPSGDAQTRRWFRKQQTIHTLDPGAIKCRRLRADDRRIENFKFWRERLSILKQVFDEAEPKTLSQWWYDRRKGPQWYTFWVAIAVLILTVFFGLVQSIEGALQVYKSW